MVTARAVAPLLRLAAAAAPPRRSPCPCALARSLTSSSSRLLSTTPTRQQQASWDSLDTDDTFKPATTLSTRDRDLGHEPARPSSSSSSSARPRRDSPPPRSPRVWDKKGKGKDRTDSPQEPPLPPLSTSTPLSALDPVHLHQFRLWLLQRLGRPPAPADLARELYPWLRREYTARERTVASELDAQRRKDEQRAQLDLAWEWERQAARNAGLPRTDAERRKDDAVLERIARRKRHEREARELERDLRAADALLPPVRSASTDKDPDPDRHVPAWRKHQTAMRTKFPAGWSPPKRLSREAMDLVRTLARSDPHQYSVARLAERFKVSPEGIRRILKSNFELPADERVKREAKRKEARARISAGEAAVEGEGEREQGAAGPERAQDTASAWGGDVAAERRELRQLRAGQQQKREQKRGEQREWGADDVRWSQ
ncbi:hypothetical protein JCM9279_004390 [Rhodotorula babjevae]